MRPVLLLALLAGLTRCASPDAPAPSVASPAVADSTRLPGEVRTETFAPTPIRITVADLPAPNATRSASRSPQEIGVPDDATLRVPAGFRVQVWADGFDAARWLALAPDGAVILAESRENRLVRLADTDGDGVADARATFGTRANGLDLPFGVAFAPAAVFVASTGEVRRWAYAPGQAALDGRGDRVVDLPGRGYNQHWTRNVVLNPAGDSLYVTVGSESNVDVEPLPRASVFRVALDGSGAETVSFGLRNPVGLAFHPATGRPYVTVNERDRLGDDLVPDFFTAIGGGRFFGWPFAYLAPQNLDPRRMQDGESERPDLAARTVTPDVLFQAHSAALGLAFVPMDAPWPARYRGGAVVAMRGSWNRSEGTGYKLVHVPFETGRPVGHYEDLVTGFLVDPRGPTTWGRPVGVLALPDGSVLFTEEANGRIYRLSYSG